MISGRWGEGKLGEKREIEEKIMKMGL